MSNLTHLILFVSFLIIKGVAQNAVIIAPATFILGINDLTINCKPAGSLYNQISAITILKNYQPMVSVGKSTVGWSDSSVKSRARTSSTNLDTVSTSQLIVNISASNTQCDDQAVYTCRVVGLDSVFNLVPDNEVSKRVFVVVKPDRIDSMTSFPLPSKKGLYSEGQNITLSCAGTVGLYSNPLKITWCIERSDNPNPSNLETDKYFLSETQSNAQVVGSGPRTRCQYARTSTVVYQVASIDTKTTFTCQITAPGDNPQCGQGTVRSSLSIEVEIEATTVSTNTSNDKESLVPAIVGGVVGTLLFVILVNLIASLIIYRRKNQSSENTTNGQVGQDNNAYHNLDSRIAISEVSTYQTLTDRGESERNVNNTYASLDNTQTETGHNTYESLQCTQSNDDPGEQEYINTTIAK